MKGNKMTHAWKVRALSAALTIFFGFSLIGVLLVDKQYKKNTTLHNDVAKCNIELKEWRAAYEHLSRTDLKPIILRLQPRLDPALAHSISESILKYSHEYRLPPELVIHIMNRESRFKPLVRSSAGAVGLMQIMTKAHKDKLKEMGITAEEAYHIDNNIKLGCWIFREYFNSGNDIKKTLLKYVGGNHQQYVEDILIGFTNEAIVGVKDVQGMREVEEGDRGTEDQNEPQRDRELEKETTNDKSNGQSS
jgi:soluble lytic murein transglycosylase-like protein